MNYFENQLVRYKKKVASNKRLNEERKRQRSAAGIVVDKSKALRNANAKLLTSTKICLS